MHRNARIHALAAALVLSACQPGSATSEKGAEEDAPLEGSLDSFRSPVDHGALVLGTPVREAIAAGASFHAWTFELTGDAALTLETADAGGGEVDTMLYLYREGPRGWGSYIARNDDSAGTLWSALSRGLRAGRYRVLVKGYDRHVRGPFELRSSCTGEGCPREPAACLFGATFGDLLSGATVAISNQETLTSVDQLFEPVQREQVVIALQQSAHTDVTRAEEAFTRVDGGAIRRVWLYDAAGARSFVAYEYGAGDSSYGAVFAQGTTSVVSRIQDGDLAGCTVRAETCLFGTTYRELRDSSRFEPVLSTVVRTPGAVSGARAAQLVAAVRVAYADASDVASALASVDGGEVSLLELSEIATGRRFVVFEYGAGDNSYGAAFEGETTAIAAEIRDGDLYACAVFGERGGARAGADCGGELGVTCGEGLRCQGFVESWGAGKCAPEGPIAGEGEPCSATTACPSEQLLCAGLTRGDEGLCLPVWMRGSFADPGPIGIPESSAGLTRVVTAYGLATVDMDVELRALIQHPRPSDLRVTLTNPAGTEVVVFDGATAGAAPGAIELDGPVRGFSGDEQVNGAWALRVVDRRRGQVGTLERWALDITSRWD